MRRFGVAFVSLRNSNNLLNERLGSKGKKFWPRREEYFFFISVTYQVLDVATIVLSAKLNALFHKRSPDVLQHFRGYSPTSFANPLLQVVDSSTFSGLVL